MNLGGNAEFEVISSYVKDEMAFLLCLRRNKKMEENIEKLGQKIKEKINSIKSMADAESVRVEALGKKGEVIEILKNLKNVEESKRKEVGEKS
jgi:hypothetical protein